MSVYFFKLPDKQPGSYHEKINKGGSKMSKVTAIIITVGMWTLPLLWGLVSDILVRLF